MSTDEVLGKGGLGGALLTDLPKAFDCIKHDRLIAKLAAYGFYSHSLSFVFSYLNERKLLQPLCSYSIWSSTRVTIRFTSFQYKHLRRFLKNTSVILPAMLTPHTFDSDFCTVLSKLKNCTIVCSHGLRKIRWNQNSDKCHLLVTTEKSVSIDIDGGNVTNTKEQKLLGIKFDSSFKGHITSFC